jgi:hypothetical protein
MHIGVSLNNWHPILSDMCSKFATIPLNPGTAVPKYASLMHD